MKKKRYNPSTTNREFEKKQVSEEKKDGKKVEPPKLRKLWETDWWENE